MRKMSSAEVRAYCQEEFNAATKTIVSASRLSVKRFAQFISSVMVAVGSRDRCLLHFRRAASATVQIVDLKFRPFPNRHLLFQFIDNPLARLERRRAMRRFHSKKQRCLAGVDKPDAMMHNNLLQLEFSHRCLARSIAIDAPPWRDALRTRFLQFRVHLPVRRTTPQKSTIAPAVRIDIRRRRFRAVLRSIKLHKPSLP